ncbi:Uncharacterised protein [Vibrio cholerae]|nr:Uncharacterised protein [Vibrio cholerae]
MVGFPAQHNRGRSDHFFLWCGDQLVIESDGIVASYFSLSIRFT